MHTSANISGLQELGRVRRPYTPRNFPALLALYHRNVVLALQVEPELRAVAEIAAEADRGVCSDRAPPVENVGDAAGRHAHVEREPIGAEFTRREFALREGGRDGKREPWSYPL